MGLQFAFPLVAMELIAEAAVGILMRIIPNINVFVVNFQVKIIVGLLILVLMFSLWRTGCIPLSEPCLPICSRWCV